jgi:hypothetical protein
MAIQAAREPSPLVTLVRSRTVANVDSIGFRDRARTLVIACLGFVDVFGLVCLFHRRGRTWG